MEKISHIDGTAVKDANTIPYLPPLNALRAFEVLGRRGSLSAAAQELNVTHGAISKQVKHLESWLGVSLVARSGRGVELTNAGRQLMERLTRAFGQINAAAQSLGAGVFEGKITISCMPALAGNWLIPKLPQFSALYPKIDILIMSAHSSEDNVVDSIRADLHLLYGRPGWAKKNIRLLTLLSIFPVCSPALANSLPGLSRVEDLMHYPLIENTEGTQWRDYLLSFGLADGTARRPYRFQDFSLCLAAARAGLGVVIGDNITAAPDLAAGRLVRPIRETIHRQNLGYYLVSHPGHETASLAAFSDWLVAEMQKTAALP